MNKNRGFTLIELLVVVVVIGILAGMVFVTIGDIQTNALNVRRRSEIRAIHSAMEMYRIQVRGGRGYTAITVGAENIITTTAIGAFLDPIPLDPSNIGAYRYRAWPSVVDSRDFCIWARMEGVALGTSGAIVAASEKGVRDMATAPASLIPCP